MTQNKEACLCKYILIACIYWQPLHKGVSPIVPLRLLYHNVSSTGERHCRNTSENGAMLRNDICIFIVIALFISIPHSSFCRPRLDALNFPELSMTLCKKHVFREVYFPLPRVPIVTYRVFYSRWKFISVPKSQHTTVKYNQPISKHTLGVYTQRRPTQDPFYRTSSGNLPKRTHILTVRTLPNTRASLAISQSIYIKANVCLSVYSRLTL
jgi:hypothetical protein